MQRTTILGGCVVGLLLSVPAARAASNLQCMDQAYSPEEQKTIDDYVVLVSSTKIESIEREAAWKVVGDRAKMCGAQNKWSRTALHMAYMYGISKVDFSEVNAQLGAQDREIYNSAIDGIDINRLKAALGPMIEAQLDNAPVPELRMEDTMIIMEQVLKHGLKMADTPKKREAQGEIAGRLAALRVLMRIANERFAAA